MGAWVPFAWVAFVLSAALVWINPGDILWNGVRSIPAGTWWRRPGFTLCELGDLSGQTVLVTGANSGLGHEVAVQCARANAAVVVLAARTKEKSESARR
jgi:NADPH:quinone reductase-like Zn-dependent oxidoreductase